MDVVDEIIRVLQQEGAEMYGGEAVTQLQHALQCATLAHRSGATPELVTAALLHDYGHMISGDDAEAAGHGIDQRHEDVAADYLSKWFPSAVVEPIRMHVPAKRYLCAADETYYGGLSPASVQSLAVQGGIFGQDEAEAFIARPFAEDAVALRRWDDLAKDPAAITIPLAEFRPIVAAALAADQEE